MSLHQRDATPEEQAYLDRIPFAAAFERAHGHEDNPSVGLADEVAETIAHTLNEGSKVLGVGEVTAEHKGDGRLKVSYWPDDDDGNDPNGTIVTFQAVRP